MRIASFFLLLTTLAISSFFSCKKGSDTEDTPTGDGTFTCLLNGESWKPCLKDEFIPGGGLQKLTVYTHGERFLKMHIIRDCKEGQGESLTVNCSAIADDLSIGRWSMGLSDHYGCGQYKHYQLDSTYNNTFKLTRFDPTSVSGVATGSFDVRFINLEPECLDTIRISKGKFNVRIQF